MTRPTRFFLSLWLMVVVLWGIPPASVHAQPSTPQVCTPNTPCALAPSPQANIAVFTASPTTPQVFEITLPPNPPSSPPIRYLWMLVVAEDTPITIQITSAQGSETLAGVRPPVSRTMVQASDVTPLVTTVTVHPDRAPISGTLVLWQADDRGSPVTSSASAPLTDDPFEPNGDALHATPLALDVPYRATLRCPSVQPDGTPDCIDGDHDFYLLTAVPRRRYLLTVSANDPIARPVVRVLSVQSLLTDPSRYPVIPWSPLPLLSPATLPFVELASGSPVSSSSSSSPLAITTVQWDTPESSHLTLPVLIVVSSEYRGNTDSILARVSDGMESSYRAAYTLRVSTGEPGDGAPLLQQRSGYAGDAVTVTSAPFYIDPPPFPDGTKPAFTIPAHAMIRVLGPQIVVNSEVWVSVQPFDRVVQGWIREEALRVMVPQEPSIGSPSFESGQPDTNAGIFPSGPIPDTNAGIFPSGPIPDTNAGIFPSGPIPDTNPSSSEGTIGIESDPLTLWNRSVAIPPAPTNPNEQRQEVVQTVCFLHAPAHPQAHVPVWVIQGVSSQRTYRFRTASDGCVRLAVEVRPGDYPVIVLPSSLVSLPLSSLPAASSVTIVVSDPNQRTATDGRVGDEGTNIK
jgi:hypothetical protein